MDDLCVNPDVAQGAFDDLKRAFDDAEQSCKKRRDSEKKQFSEITLPKLEEKIKKETALLIIGRKLREIAVRPRREAWLKSLDNN
jgi:hypothetical protein